MFRRPLFWGIVFLFSLCFHTQGQEVRMSWDISSNKARLQIADYPPDISGIEIYDNNNQLAKRIKTHRGSTVTWKAGKASTNYSIRLLKQDGEIYYEDLVISPSRSSGEIKVYFNMPVEETLSNGLLPETDSGVEILNAMLYYINNASEHIDVAMYNNDRMEIVQALEAAVERGVQVRYITDDERSNKALRGPLKFPVLKGNDAGLMHNKFLSIDANDENDAWLICGALNFTTAQIATDANHMVAIQDKSLALVYRTEFEEMWGSSEALPNENLSKFGSAKTKNTPSSVTLNDGTIVDVRFSPTDGTSNAIINFIGQAESELDIALLLLTHDPISNSLLNAHNNNITVRGIIDNVSSTSSDYDWLKNKGLDLIHDQDAQVIFHHKYAIADAASNQTAAVLTGSHNWTFSAETKHDENLLIIHNPLIANVFRQEFERRWCERRSSECLTAITEIRKNTEDPLKIYYDSSGHRLHLFSNSIHSEVDYIISDIGGKIIQSDRFKWSSGVDEYILRLGELNAGIYSIMLKFKAETIVRKFIVQQ
jgi:phosphatidylserine/phosphatidylglycerophosphate/cardiolipin synthase-like enzyme